MSSLKLGLIVVAALTFPCTSQAATFLAVPAVYNQSHGPFTIAFRTQGSQESLGVSYKLSTEPTWHRCLAGPQSLTVGPLEDGRYTIQIADDISLNYWASIGQLYSGHTAPCFATPPPDNLMYVPTGYSFVVDSAVPEVSDVSVQSAGTAVRLTAQATDAVSGVERVEWVLGDGGTRTTTSPQLDYQYLAAGTYSGSIRVVDRAGNATARTFSVAVAATPLPSTVPVPGSGADPSPKHASATCTARRKQLAKARVREKSARAMYQRHHTAKNRKRWRKARTDRITRERSVAAKCR